MKDSKEILNQTQETIKTIRLTQSIIILALINLSSPLMQVINNLKTEVLGSLRTE